MAFVFTKVVACEQEQSIQGLNKHFDLKSDIKRETISLSDLLKKENGCCNQE